MNRPELPSMISKRQPEDVDAETRRELEAKNENLRPLRPARTAAVVERERKEQLEVKYGLRDAPPPKKKSGLADELRGERAPVNANPEMSYDEAVRRDAEGTLPTRNGRPRPVLTEAGWYSPPNQKPPRKLSLHGFAEDSR